MLSEDQIREALHARRVVPVPVPDPHGPLGLEYLAEVVARATGMLSSTVNRVERPLTLPLGTWEKLEILARSATKSGFRRFTASDVAASLIEQVIGAAHNNG